MSALTFPAVRRSMPSVAWWVICVLLAFLFAFPIVMTVMQSLKSPEEAQAIPPTLYPHNLSLDSYLGLSGRGASINIFQNAANSALVSLGAVVGVVIIATLAGYGFARLSFPGSAAIFYVLLGTFMIPFQAITTPLYVVLQQLHLQNSLIGLTLVYMTFQLPFGLFVMRNSFRDIPRAIEEAAVLDGCGPMRALVRVLLPVVVPGLVTTALFTFFTTWNEFFAALIFITDQSKFTLPVTLSILQTGQLGALNWGILEAGVAVTMIPCIVIYILLQRYYVSGLVTGATK